MEINKNDLRLYYGVTHGISLPSKLIKWFQWGDSRTHAFFVLPGEEDNIDPNQIEADFGGVRTGKLSEFHTPKTKYDIYYVECESIEQKNNIVSDLKKTIGMDYDYLGLLGFANRSKGVENEDKVFCSENIYNVFYKNGLRLFNTLKGSQVFPSLLTETPLATHYRMGFIPDKK